MDYHYIIKGKPSYYSMSIDDKTYLTNRLSQIKIVCDNMRLHKRKSIGHSLTNFYSELVNDEHFVKIVKFYYIEKQIGIKSICKLLDSVISYSSLRGIFDRLGILTKGTNHIFTDEQKKMRSYNARNKITPNYPCVYTQQHLSYNSNKQGIQGYYFSKMYNKNIWIRSTYEYIVIDHLETNNINYMYETKEYTLKDGRKYRPDFHLLDAEGNIEKIVEIKSNYYLSHQDDKAYMLQNDIENVFVIFNVDGICEFFKINDKPKDLYCRKLKEWKLIRRTKNEVEQN